MANITHRDDPTTYYPLGDRNPFRMMRDMLRWEPFREATFPSMDVRAFEPNFDVKETKDSLIIHADVPGMTEKDVSISVAGNRLTLSGERKAEQRQEDENYHMFERSYGSFHRTFTLPEEVDVEAVQAELRDGVLRLTLPKKADAQPRRIQVTSGR